MPSSAKFPVFGSVNDLMTGVMRAYFAGQDIHIGTLLSEGLTDDHRPVIIARRDRRSGADAGRSGDDRFVRSTIVAVETLTYGADADDDGEMLQEAAWRALRWAQQTQIVIPDGGSISEIENRTEPARVSDWATSTGVVQYASLPKGWVRYESIYRLIIRPPIQANVINPFVSFAEANLSTEE